MKLPFIKSEDNENKIQLKKALKEQTDAKRLNPKWLVPFIITTMILGLLWIVIFYLTASTSSLGYPLPWIGNWNIAIGLVLILVGFCFTTVYK